MISRMSSIYGSVTLFLYKNTHTTWSFLESGEVPTDRRTSKRRIMQVSSSVSNRYYTPYQTNTSVKYCAGFSQTEDGKLTPNETTENPGFAEFVDYQEFHKAWMSQGAETAFSYTSNNGFNAEANSISLVPGMSVRLSNGFRLAIGDYMVQALGDFKDNQAASESAAIAGALSHLIKVANGQIPMNMFYSKNQDNSAYAKIGLQAFGIDTSRPFTINGRTFHFDGDEQIRMGSGQHVDEEYQINTVPEDEEAKNEETVKTDISARYATDSTKENPIVEVSLQIGGETITQEINISEVNPRKATQLEMYAFFYHQDMVTGEKNTYQKFLSYVENAVQNGHFEGNQNYGDFTEKEYDWQKVIISMWEDYSDAGIYSQMQECIKLNETMEKASIQFVDFDNITLVNRSSEVFFTYPGMNVPEQLQVAWMESAGAMEDTQRYSHLTQVLYRRIEAELEGKDLQDEAGVIDATIEAVKKALQDLENTPTETIANQPDVQEEMQELKSYYEAFIQNLEALKEGGAETTETETEEITEDITVNYREFFAMYMEQIFIKIQSGDTEPTYQIGSQSFTEKEWETFLEKFDSIEEAIQELVSEEQARKEAEEVNQENELTGTVSAGNGIPGNHGLETWYQGEKVEWSANDTKYTDPKTGISYYVRDGKHPYMTEEDAEKLKELCQETGEPWLKKFAEITGMIQQLDNNTTAFVGSNGTLIKSKDGKELFIDTSSLTYDAIMSLFKDLPSNGNYFDSCFWEERIRAVEKENVSAIDDGALLTAETTSCKYETANPDDDDVIYVTFYTTDGIRCKKLGAEDFEWTLTFENKEQYDKVMEFIGQFPSDWNMRFAAHENFWNDFLNDEIDMEGFMEFINGTNKGVPDFSVTIGDSMYVDKEKMQWAKYTNPLETRFYTAEEMQAVFNEEVESNQHKKKTLYEMLRDSASEGTNARYSFVGEDRIYSFYEFLDEIQRRSLNNNTVMQ